MNVRACYIVLALVAMSFAAQAQYTSRLGKFRVDQIEGCAPLTVNITIIPPAQCDGANPCDMFYGDTPSGQNLTFTHTYSTAGTFLLQVLFQTVGFDDINITVNPNVQPTFDLYTCGGNEVSVNITDTNFDNYVIDYNDGSPVVVLDRQVSLKNNHTYASPGAKNVTVRGLNDNSADNCSSSNKSINAMATLPTPTITQLTVVDATSLTLDFNALPNIQYKLEIAPNTSSTFQLIKNVYNVVSETVSNLKTEDNYYCFRLGVYDPCNNTTVYSNTICSANVDLAVQNNANVLSWITRTTGVSNFRVTRTTSGSTLNVSASASPFTDSDIICGTNYCYQLTTLYPNGSSSISLQKCGTTISNDIPTAINNISAVVNGSSVDLDWQAIPGFTANNYFLYKSDGGDYSLLSTFNALSYTDNTYTSGNTCYKIYYDDVCGNKSPLSGAACPIVLTPTLQGDNTILLNWTPYEAWTSGVREYIVQKFTPDGQLMDTFQPGTALTLLDDALDLNFQSVVYVVTAVPNEPGVTQSVSNRVLVIRNPNIFYPTAFTPNGDNLNDHFDVNGHYIVDFELSIFNRWGELMYTTTDIGEGWDGVYKGNPMPEGTYTFIANITDRAGRQFKKSGSVLLLRKK